MFGFAGVDSAVAEDVPNSVLAQMGLGSIERISDEQGMQTRGQGTASVFGIGFSSLIVASDLDTYTAASGPIANALATGSSQTTSQLTAQINVLGATASLSLIAATAGSSFAFAR